MTTLIITTKWNDESLNADTETILHYYDLEAQDGYEDDNGHYWMVEYTCFDVLPRGAKVEIEEHLDADDNVISYHWESN